MNNLTVIENELVPVYETSTGEKVVYGSELHEVLGVKSNYREWIKRRALDIDEKMWILPPSKFRQCQVELQRKTISSSLIPLKKWQCLREMKMARKYADILSA